MLAYQVCECASSARSSPATMDRSTPSTCSAALAAGQRAGRAVGEGVRLALARLAEAVHVHLDELAQGGHQVFDVDAGSAVHVRWVFAGEQADAHPCTVGHPADPGCGDGKCSSALFVRIDPRLLWLHGACGH